MNDADTDGAPRLPATSTPEMTAATPSTTARLFMRLGLESAAATNHNKANDNARRYKDPVTPVSQRSDRYPASGTCRHVTANSAGKPLILLADQPSRQTTKVLLDPT